MDDLISRRAAVCAIRNLYPWRPMLPWLEDTWRRANSPYLECENAIERLPIADRPKGVWVQKNYYDTDWNVYECNQCGEPWQLEAGTPKDNNMNYCPHCGADMRGVDDESTL